MTGLLALQNSGSKYFVVLFCLLVFFVFFRGGGGGWRCSQMSHCFNLMARGRQSSSDRHVYIV